MVQVFLKIWQLTQVIEKFHACIALDDSSPSLQMPVI
jgi:hypothetical protein